MKITKIIIIGFILQVGTCLCEKDTSICNIVNDVKIYLLDSNITDFLMLTYKIIDDELVVFDNSFEKDGTNFVYNLYFPAKSEKYSVFIPDSIWDSRNWIEDFTILPRRINILNRESLYVFQNKDSAFYLSKQIHLNDICYYLNKTDAELIGYICGFRSGKTTTLPATYIISIDTNTFSFKKIDYENPKGLGWVRIQPRKLMDVKNNLVAISYASRYFIKIVNRQNNLTDTLTRYPNDWISEQTSMVRDSLKANTNQDLLELMSSRSLVQRIHFLGDNLLMVAWQSPPKEDGYYYDLYFDLWSYNDELKKWNIMYSDLKNCVENDSVFNIHDLKISSFELSENSILSIHYIPYEATNFIGQNKKNVKKIFDDYYRINKPRYSIIRRIIK